MGSDEDEKTGPPTPRAIPMRRPVQPVLPPRRDTPPTRPSPARNREQGPLPPLPPKPGAKEPIVPTLASIAGALTVLVARFDELEKTIGERPSGPPSSEVISLATTPLPKPAELLEAAPRSTPTPPESRPSLPVRAAKATGHVAKATAKNPIVRVVLLAAAFAPWVTQGIAWIRGVNVGPIVSMLRMMADALETLAGGK